MSELHHAREQARPLVQIRVTPLAIEGAITTVPMAPERSRVKGKLRAVPTGHSTAVIADPENERLLEVLIHPEDWNRLLVELPTWDHHGASPLTALMGVPIAERSR